ncbi:MAG: GNAT family N-acetyltransferase [Coriobacteriia bacterium]
MVSNDNLPQRIDPASRPRPARLAGPRVTLRPLTDADVEALAEILDDPEVAPWWPITTPEALRIDIGEDEDSVPFCIEVGGELAGIIMYEEVLWRDYFSAGIDIALGGGWVGRGLGTEALSVLARWLFDAGGHHRLTIDPAASNARAIRAYSKVGFKPVGVMRQYERMPDGTWRDGLLMDMLAEELVWPSRG